MAILLDDILLGSNRVVHRNRGEIPGCIPAPHDKTMLESMGKCEESTADLFVKIIELYDAGYYPAGSGWSRVSNELRDISKLGWQGEMLRRDVKARTMPTKRLVP